jgi:hypothetical protein
VAALLHRGLLTTVGTRLAIPRIDQVTLDLRVVSFTMIVALATGVAFGLVPALISVSSSANALREGGRSIDGRKSHRALNALVVIEVALSLVLLVGAGLLLRSFVNQRGIDTGYRTDGVLAARVSLPGSYDLRRATRLFGEMSTRLSVLPGVHSVAAAGCLPSAGCDSTASRRLTVNGDRARFAPSRQSSSRL